MTSPSSSDRNRRRVLQLVLGGVGLYVLVPSLLHTYGDWRSLGRVTWWFALLAVLMEVLAYVCIWELDRIVLHTNQWFAVVTTQLSANAVGRITPAGGVSSNALGASMLERAGVAEKGDASAAFGTSSYLQLMTTLAMPIVALPAIIGGAPVNHSLATAATLGIVFFVLLLAAGFACFTTDAPLELVGRAVQWTLNHTLRRKQPIHDLPQQLIAYRDSALDRLGGRWPQAVAAAAGSTLFDYAALLAALWSVGASPRPSLVILAYTAAQALALIPITPGGLGFVEGGLVGMLGLAGVPAGDAYAATLVYRTTSYWLPLPAGAVAYRLFRRRYPEGSGESTSETPGGEHDAPSGTAGARGRS